MRCPPGRFRSVVQTAIGGEAPDFAIHWNRVDILLWTHKINGLHENDFIMAAKINGLAQADTKGDPP
ncbi:MAG: 4a-hydroxytetrahydrobiopterin dehydratase [Gemmatimonadales bacterium]|nr:4a-hydroxytetrahydrobiopterin dehydratase [Gemmatimonadales bacterium]